MFHTQLKKLEIGRLYRDDRHEYLVFNSPDAARKAKAHAEHAEEAERSAVSTGWASAPFWQSYLQQPVVYIPANKVFMPVEYNGKDVVVVKVIAEGILGWMVKPDYWYNIEELGKGLEKNENA